MNLPQEDWKKLSQYQQWALEILSKSGGASIEPECPGSMRQAMHDMWRFGFAKREFDPECAPRLGYKITPLGRDAAREIGITDSDQPTQETS